MSKKLSKINLSQEQLKENYTYNPLTGKWYHAKDKDGGRQKKGAKVGHMGGGGYGRIKINNKYYTTGKLAFLYMTGFFPKHLAGHKNKDKYDDRWENLVDCTLKDLLIIQGVCRDDELSSKILDEMFLSGELSRKSLSHYEYS